MKIGILTFHWATNYGAVLQCYALQQALTQLGHDVEIIDYYPKRYKKNILYPFRTKRITHIKRRFTEVRKEKKIAIFRTRNLKCSKYFSSNKELKNFKFDYDCVICGSDQIWNESFTRHAEHKRTYTYFLDFVPDDIIKASYAASFGTTKYPEDLISELKSLFARFDFISVREKTGLDILKDAGVYNAQIVPDPTLLLGKADYEKFIEKINKGKNAFIYMLHDRMADADGLVNYAKNDSYEINVCQEIGINEWLSGIYNSDVVITNSFHGIVFSIILEKQFVAFMVEGSGMNDRIHTLLGKLNLTSRIYNGDTNIIHQPIEWSDVKSSLDDYRKDGYVYLTNLTSKE